MTDETTDPLYLRTFAHAAREEGDEETAFVVERAAAEIGRLRHILRVNLLRHVPGTTHEAIDALLDRSEVNG